MPKVTEFDKVALRSTSISAEEWDRLIKERCELISGYLDRVTLQTLEDVPFMEHGGSAVSIAWFEKTRKEGTGHDEWRTQGVFWPGKYLFDPEQRVILGFTRQRKFVACIIKMNVLGSKISLYDARVREATLGEMEGVYGCPRSETYSRLGIAVSDWTAERRQFLWALEALEERLRREDLLIQRID